MGWTNYIILPKYKLGFEVSREVNMSYMNKDIVEEIEGAQEEEFDRHKKFSEFTLEDLRVVLNKLLVLSGLDIHDIELLFLMKFDDDIKVITEMNMEDKEYEGYTWIKVRREE